MTKYTIEIDDELSERMESAAHASNLSASDLIAECVLQHLDVAARYWVLINRVDLVDQGLLELASFIGEATGSGTVDVSNVCRYVPPKA